MKKLYLATLATLLALAIGPAVADGITGYAGICKSTGRLCPNQLPPPLAAPVSGYITGTGTGTATVSATATSTGTLTATATVTGTFTAAGTGTVTGTGTLTATGVVTLTKTATGTVTKTVTGTGTGTSTTTEMHASIGNASAAPALLSIGTSGQTQFDPQGNETSSGNLTMTGDRTVADFGADGYSVSVGNGFQVPFLGFNARIDSSYFRYGRGSANSFAAGILHNPANGSLVFLSSPAPGWAKQQFSPRTLLQLDYQGNATFLGAVTGTGFTGHATSDLLLPASGVCSAGQVLTYLTTGAPTCVTNGSGTGIGCNGTCSSPSFAVFTDSTHVTNAPYTPAQASDITSAVNAAVNGSTGYVPYFSSAHTIGSLAPYATTPAANSVPISDSSGTLNAWITYHVQNIQALVGPSGSGSTSGLTPLNVIGSTFTAVSASGSVSVTATANVSTTAGLNTCVVTLLLNGSQIGVQGQTNAGVATVPVAGLGNFTGGSYSLTVTLTSNNGSYGCGTQAHSTQLIVTEYSN